MTAVEWLIDRIAEKSVIEKDRYYIPYNSGTIDITHIIEQAKEMEKQQIIDAWDIRNQDVIKSDGKTSEQYYNETYGSNGSDVTSSQTEISDEEIKEKIEKALNNFKQDHSVLNLYPSNILQNIAEFGAKWYREQLKQRQ